MDYNTNRQVNSTMPLIIIIIFFFPHATHIHPDTHTYNLFIHGYFWTQCHRCI